ncbi:hypothetical protein Syun_003881 [Stephania yunnanensis]|uniref:DDE Tnp4 domain-containing protein n=1 Tax=Stephania yunnanensis TaxID=152371 RepID=A0AAP0L4Z1_9MAGN
MSNLLVFIFCYLSTTRYDLINVKITCFFILVFNLFIFNMFLGKYFLVDYGFPNRRQFLAPFRCVRYHLFDFTGQGRHLENANELFNLRHASLRNVVERLFGIFKSRFTIFKTAPPFSFKIQAELVLACAGLHNYLRKECRFDEFPIELDTEDALSSDSEEDDDFEILSETQDNKGRMPTNRGIL